MTNKYKYEKIFAQKTRNIASILQKSQLICIYFALNFFGKDEVSSSNLDSSSKTRPKT